MSFAPPVAPSAFAFAQVAEANEAAQQPAAPAPEPAAPSVVPAVKAEAVSQPAAVGPSSSSQAPLDATMSELKPSATLGRSPSNAATPAASPARPKRAAGILAAAQLSSSSASSSGSSGAGTRAAGSSATPLSSQPVSPATSASSPCRERETPIAPAYFYPRDASSATASDMDGVPVFEPTMAQFSDFERFCERIDAWGMQCGIVKIVPPPEWRAALPSLRSFPPPQTGERGEDPSTRGIASVRIRNAISQKWESAGGGSGAWLQQNHLHPSKVWNAKMWADACAAPGARGPELRRMQANAERADGIDGAKPDGKDEGIKTRSGRGRDSNGAAGHASSPAVAAAAARRRKRVSLAVGSPAASQGAKDSPGPSSLSQDVARPSTPQPALEVDTSDMPALEASPLPKLEGAPAATPPGRTLRPRSLSTAPGSASKVPLAAEPTPHASQTSTAPPVPKVKAADLTTAEEWAAFDHENVWLREFASAKAPAAEPQKTEEGTAQDDLVVPSAEDFRDPKVCREIEKEYWRGLTFGQPPMYGADLKGTLFTDETTSWNVGKLPNILTRLRLKRKLPGVTTPYLYFGSWRATFAWHVEDVDLYSINYIHFGAPKQWYSIRQADRTRFELAMASAFPADSRRCRHFLRHKSYLASPAFLAAHNIQPLRLVHHAGEFVITYPYGYHSGFNLGFNCAESVNFALPSWLEIGRRAGWCECEPDSVRMDIDAILQESEEIEEAERKKEEHERRKEERAALRAEKDAQLPDDEAARMAKLEARRLRDKARRDRQREEKLLAREAGLATPDAREADVSLDAGQQVADQAAPARGRASEAAEAQQEDELEQSASGSSSGSEDEPFCAFCVSNNHDDLVVIPSDSPDEPVRHGHRLCSLFVPETFVQPGEEREDGVDTVIGFENIPKARWQLKCTLCPKPQWAKQGAKVQCTFGTCARAAHVACAFVEETGWLLDVLPLDAADAIEGRKKKAGGKARSRKAPGTAAAGASSGTEAASASDGNAAAEENEDEDVETRNVVLCTLHNPNRAKPISPEAARREAVQRALALALRPQDLATIHLGGAQWCAPVVRVVREDAAEPDVPGSIVIMEAGAERFIKWAKLVFSPEQVRAEEEKWNAAEARRRAELGLPEEKPAKKRVRDEDEAQTAAERPTSVRRSLASSKPAVPAEGAGASTDLDADTPAGARKSRRKAAPRTAEPQPLTQPAMQPPAAPSVEKLLAAPAKKRASAPGTAKPKAKKVKAEPVMAIPSSSPLSSPAPAPPQVQPMSMLPHAHQAQHAQAPHMPSPPVHHASAQHAPASAPFYAHEHAYLRDQHHHSSNGAYGRAYNEPPRSEYVPHDAASLRARYQQHAPPPSTAHAYGQHAGAPPLAHAHQQPAPQWRGASSPEMGYASPAYSMRSPYGSEARAPSEHAAPAPPRLSGPPMQSSWSSSNGSSLPPISRWSPRMPSAAPHAYLPPLPPQAGAYQYPMPPTHLPPLHAHAPGHAHPAYGPPMSHAPPHHAYAHALPPPHGHRPDLPSAEAWHDQHARPDLGHAHPYARPSGISPLQHHAPLLPSVRGGP